MKKQVDRNDLNENDLPIHKGYGSWRMADFLNKEGDKVNTGGSFSSIRIICILKAPFYCNRLEDETTSEQIQVLKLRSEDTYEQILYIPGQSTRRFIYRKELNRGKKNN